jgi:pyruvate formate lyase activating enzyme
MSPEEVMAEIEPSLFFIRGLTVSGGECTLYPDFLRELGKLARNASPGAAMGIAPGTTSGKALTFFLDSNGNYDFAGDPALMEQVDAVMLDIKADPANPAEYKRVTGNDGAGIFEQADYLAGAGKLWEIRTVVSPGLFDAPALVDKVCRRLARYEPKPLYKLIRYRPVGVRPEAAAMLREAPDTLMEELAAICAGYGIKAVVV